jgi:hypothetical protein
MEGRGKERRREGRKKEGKADLFCGNRGYQTCPPSKFLKSQNPSKF